MHNPSYKLGHIVVAATVILASGALPTVQAAPPGHESSDTTASNIEGSAEASLTLDTTQLQPGERATGVLRLEDDWPELPSDSRLVLVADASGSMAGGHNTALKDALSAMIQDLHLDEATLQPPDVPNPTWTRVPVTGSLTGQLIFTVALPPGWAVSPQQGIDSDVGVISGDGVQLEFDYGMWSNPLPDPGDPGYEVTFEPIGCRDAKLVQPRSAPANVTGVYWADTGQAIWNLGDPDKLQISGRDLSAEAHTVALAILRSVRFSGECGGSGGTQVAVVEFNSIGRLLCELTADTAALLSCVQRIGAAGGTNIAEGMETGLRELTRQGPPPTSVAEVMVVFADGGNNGGCPVVLGVADLVKERGALIITVAMGENTDQSCLIAASSSPRHHYYVPDSTGLGPLFSAIRQRIQSKAAVEGISLDLSLPANVMLVPDSATLPPVESDAQSARWALPSSADHGVEISFEVEAQALGRSSAGVAATYLLKSGEERTFSGASEPVAVGDAPQCSCPISDQVFTPSGTALASPPAAFSGSAGCSLSRLAREDVSWAEYELCSASSAATIQVGGPGTVVVYQPSFDPAFPCRFAVAASETGKPFSAPLAPGPFTVAVFSAEPPDSARRIQLDLDCSGAVPPDPTPIATPSGTEIFLPIVGQAACLIESTNDLMLVVDVSHSMREPLAGGVTKLAAAQEGADALLAALSDTGDQAGLVTFSERAELRQPLSPSLGTVGSALRGVQTAQGTAIEAGLAVARRELAGPRHRGSSRGLIVLLTDGRSHPAPASAAIAEAAAARSAGVQIWSIGIGPEVDVRTLQQVAGLPTRFRHAQRPEELSSAFLAVGRGVSCRSGVP